MDNVVEQQVAEYQQRHPTYEAYVNSIDSLLSNLISAGHIDLVTLEARAKTVESFREKVQLEDKDYKDPLKEITDLAGVRIITYQLADIDSIANIVRDNFDVDEDNSIDKREILDADRFGYLSVHFVVTLNNARAGLPEYRAFAGMKAEIQVRTVLQHAWAAIDHKLRYKRREEIPLNLRRKLYRISALLETADSEFESLRSELEETRRRYQKDIAAQNLDIDVDIDSLSAFAETGDTPQRLFSAATEANSVIMPHKSRQPEFSLLLSMLETLQIKSLAQFDDLLKGVVDDFPQIVNNVNKKWHESVNDENLRLVLPRESVLRFAVLFSQPAEVANTLATRLFFGDKLRSALQSVYRNRHSTEEFTLPIKQSRAG